MSTLAVLGAFVLAIFTVLAVVRPPGLGDWWRRQSKAVRVVTAVPSAVLIALAVVAVAAFFIESLGSGNGDEARSAGSGSGQPSPSSSCVVRGQVFDLEGGQMPPSSIVARPLTGSLYSYYYGGPDVPSPTPPPLVIATTDAEGRFEGDCQKLDKPFRVAVIWEVEFGSDEDCEWWGIQPETRIEREGVHTLNIVIPLREVQTEVYTYTDDYLCTSYLPP